MIKYESVKRGNIHLNYTLVWRSSDPRIHQRCCTIPN